MPFLTPPTTDMDDSGANPGLWQFKACTLTILIPAAPYKQEAQLMLTTGSTRLAVSRGQ